ncbi:MAG: DUF2336 domain-containing protein [Bauldia sp.]|nr:DUF2336 domain-containing protein [Bauldia sp.]
MSSSRPFAGLEPVALTSATRDQVLLRAATDHFMLAHTHEPDAIRQYEELATHYLPRTTIADRIYVSERLATRADAPVGVVRILARDIIAVAAPVLLRSKALTTLDLLTVISGTSLEHHRLLAQRDTLPDEVVTALRLKNETGTLNILRARGIIPDTRAKAEAPRAEAEPAKPAKTAAAKPLAKAEAKPDLAPASAESAKVEAVLASAIEAEIAAPIVATPAPAAPPAAPLPITAPPPARKSPGEQFLALDRAARLAIIAETAGGKLPSAHWSSPRKLERLVKTTFRRSQIKGYVRARMRPELIEALSDGLGLAPDFVAACLDDRSGEPMVLLARAMGLNQADGKDLLLLVNPAIGHSVPDFIRLADLHDAMEPEVAEAIVAVWRGETVSAPQHLGVVSNAPGARRPAIAAEGGRAVDKGTERGKASA